jgi:hypothetical protein
VHLDSSPLFQSCRGGSGDAAQLMEMAIGKVNPLEMQMVFETASNSFFFAVCQLLQHN